MIPISVLRQKGISSTDKIVYGIIYSFKPELCYMRTSDFMQKMDCSRLTVLSAIRRLKDKNLVRKSTYGGLEALELKD